MSVECGLAFMLIISLYTIVATSREIKFIADGQYVDHKIPTEGLKSIDIPFGSNLTLTCDCKNCSTIEFLKKGAVKFKRYFSGSICQINNVTVEGACKPHSTTHTFEVKTRNIYTWFCRGETIKGSWVISLGHQLIITSKRTTTRPGLETSGQGVQKTTENSQNNIITISAVVSVLVVVLVVVTVIFCRKKRNYNQVTKLNSTSPEDKRAVKDTPGSRESVCVMAENEICESNDSGFVMQDSTPENRKSICLMEANPLYEST